MSKNKVGIISYGCGNIRSVRNALDHINVSSELVSAKSELKNYKKLILPGVGSFGHARNLLSEGGMDTALMEWVQDTSNKLIGICVGMQLLCNSSEETTQHNKGLGLIDADIKMLKSNTENRLPNIGWSEVNYVDSQFRQYDGDFYFVHSYAAFCKDDSNILGKSYYGDQAFASAITNSKNVLGFQFHPEKSHKIGLSVLREVTQI